MRWLRRGLAVVLLMLVLLVLGKGGHHLSPLDIAVAPHHFNLVTWEVTHLPGKWLHKLRTLLPGGSDTRGERLEKVEEFFRLGGEIGNLRQDIARLSEQSNSDQDTEIAQLESQLEELLRRRSKLTSGVEETIEGAISSVLAQEGLRSRLGLIFPPVDLAFDTPPKVLILSPRDRIELVKALILNSGMTVVDMEKLEDMIFADQDMAALIENTGGIGFYPSVVPPSSNLLDALTTASHEWLHHYLFFHPLGFNYFSGPDMTTLNETAANIVGKELGERAYEALTGIRPPPPDDKEKKEPLQFDFDAEMRKTRRQVEELLTEGRIEEAEEYMEKRRKLFVQNGYYIRKLNQAYFAFYGSYGDLPASISPIHSELMKVRQRAESLGDFIKAIGGFSSYQEFKDYVERLREGSPTTT